MLSESIGDLLIDALMRPGAVEVIDVLMQNAMELAAVQNEHVIQAFSLQSADEALTK